MNFVRLPSFPSRIIWIWLGELEELFLAAADPAQCFCGLPEGSGNPQQSGDLPRMRAKGFEQGKDPDDAVAVRTGQDCLRDRCDQSIDDRSDDQKGESATGGDSTSFNDFKIDVTT